jgi:hypothetical protein
LQTQGVDLSGQGDGFILASFTLSSLALGTTALTIDSFSSLSDEAANSLSFGTINGSFKVATPDVANSGALLALVLMIIAIARIPRQAVPSERST